MAANKLLWLIGLALVIPLSAGASTVHTLTDSWLSKVPAAAAVRGQFAVPVKQAVTLADGTWAADGADAVWTYAISLPSAVSVSFHADQFQLPPGGTLKVTGADGYSHTYNGLDGAGGGLWSRIAPGTTLQLELRVPAALKDQVKFSVEEFQSGFKSLGGTEVKDSPLYAHLAAQGAAADPSTCVENYECDASADNANAAASSVALTVNNTFQCSGTLLNDTSGDFRNLVLTARHCQGDTENPAASGVVFYFGATTACGKTLGSIFGDNVATASGAVTKAENQDAWLLEMSTAIPAAYKPYYSGWDATGGTFTGGYGIHFDANNDAQYSAYFGQAVAAPAGGIHGVSFTGTSWGLNNSKGTTLDGASGSGLFDPNNRLVGELIGGGVACPAATPTAPIPPGPGNSSGTFQMAYTQLASVWQTDASKDSSGSGLIGTLDAAKTNKLVIDGAAGSAVVKPTVQLSASSTNATAGTQVTLSWSTQNAVSCTASGGGAGDGWPGTAATTGSKQVTESSGAYIYTLACTNSAGSNSQAFGVTYSGGNSSSGGSSSTGGSNGGGGVFEPLIMGFYAIGVLSRRRQLRRRHRLPAA